MTTYTNSEHLQSLQQQIVHANSLLQQAWTNLQDFQTLLTSENLATHEWPPEVRDHYNFLTKHHTRAQNQFFKCSTALRLHESATKPTPANSPKPTREPPKPPVLGTLPIQQTVEVTVVDGQTHSNIDADAHRWLPRLPMATAEYFTRHYFFPNAIVPPEYAFVLQHNGVQYQPMRSVFISYDNDEFKRLCQLEIDTNSPHLLDGKRLKYELPKPWPPPKTPPSVG